MIGEAALVAEAVEQRLQRPHVLGRRRDVGALVAAEVAEHQRIVVARRSRVDLQHQAVVEAHPRHLGQHLAAELLGLGRRDRTGERALEQPLAVRLGEVAGQRRRVAVVGRGRPHRLEERAAVAVRGEVALPGQRVLAGERAEALDVVAEALELGVDDRVGAVGGDHAPLPAAGADLLVVDERIERRLGGRDHLDVEALEQRPRPERRCGQRRVDAVEIAVGGLGRRAARRCRTPCGTRGRATSASACRGTGGSARRRCARSCGRPARPARRRGAECRGPRAECPGCRASGTRSGRA